MSSVLKPPAVTPGSVEIPFASYAQLVRMLVPPAERISFYDARSEALWVNDGVEEPEFRMRVELTMSRARSSQRQPGGLPSSAPSEQDDPSYVFAIRNPQDNVVGALGIECRNLPAGARYRSPDTVERILNPLLEILGHAWPPEAVAAPAPQSVRDAGTRQAMTAAQQLQSSMPAPALLRKTLSLATGLIDCSFGAIVLPERPFTLSQRVSPDESDLAITSAIDNVREHVLKWMHVRDVPLVINAASASRPRQLPYKLLVVPVRDATNRIVALMMLFRNPRARDFASVDVDELVQLAARVPTDVLSALTPDPPVIVSVVDRPQVSPAARSQMSRPAAQPQRPVAASDHHPALSPVVAPGARDNRRVDTPRVGATAAPARTTSTAMSGSTPIANALSVVSMDARIRSALRDGGFDLYAQKIAAMREAELSPRFEVLLRMRDAGKLHTPPNFFGAAETGRLMPEVDCWVIGELLKTLRKRAVTVRASSLEFSINIAAQSLTTEQFGEFIVAEVCRSAIPAGLLVFEVSERTALAHEDAMEHLSARLRDVGCRIALDNCRSGLGTLDPLNKWPVSRVKIDGSLIRSITDSSRSESQVRAVVQLAADRGIETVAECVETQRIHDKLLDIGIDYAQGFHLARPQPLQTLFQ